MEETTFELYRPLCYSSRSCGGKLGRGGREGERKGGREGGREGGGREEGREGLCSRHSHRIMVVQQSSVQYLPTHARIAVCRVHPVDWSILEVVQFPTLHQLVHTHSRDCVVFLTMCACVCVCVCVCVRVACVRVCVCVCVVCCVCV